MGLFLVLGLHQELSSWSFHAEGLWTRSESEQRLSWKPYNDLWSSIHSPDRFSVSSRWLAFVSDRRGDNWTKCICIPEQLLTCSCFKKWHCWLVQANNPVFPDQYQALFSRLCQVALQKQTQLDQNSVHGNRSERCDTLIWLFSAALKLRIPAPVVISESAAILKKP